VGDFCAGRKTCPAVKPQRHVHKVAVKKNSTGACCEYEDNQFNELMMRVCRDFLANIDTTHERENEVNHS